MKLKKKDNLRRRHWRIRSKIKGTADRPRVAIRKSLKHFYVVVVDDSPETGSLTLGSFTTASKDAKGKHMANADNGAKLGKTVGEELKKRGVETIVFDRGGYRYHGCVKAIAEAMREAGIAF